MASLNTFGAVFTFEIELEAQLNAYYIDIDDAAMAKAADKRRKKLERVRRESIRWRSGSSRSPDWTVTTTRST